MALQGRGDKSSGIPKYTSPIPSVMSLTVQSHWKQSSGNNWYKQKYLFIWRKQQSLWISFSNGNKKGKEEKQEPDIYTNDEINLNN